MDAPSRCPNCDARLTGPFCAQCGQRLPNDRLTLRGLGREVSSRVFSFDRGLWHTLARLASGPGRVPADYVEGRRQRYTHPVSFYLLAAAVSLFAFGLMAPYTEAVSGTTPAVIRIDAAEGTLADSLGVPNTPLNRALQQADGPDRRGLARQFNATWRRIGTPLLVLFALIVVPPLRLLLGARRNLAETAVFSLYVTGFITLALAVLSPILVWTLGARVGLTIQGVGTLFAYPAVTAWGATAFYAPGKRTVVRAVVASFLGYLVYSLVGAAISGYLVFDKVLDEAGLDWSAVFG